MEIRSSIKKMMLTACTSKVQAIVSFLPRKVRGEGKKRGPVAHNRISVQLKRRTHAPEVNKDKSVKTNVTNR